MPNKLAIIGKAYWARVFDWYENMNGEQEMGLEVSLNPEAIQTLKQAGLGGKIKDKGGERGPYISLTRNKIKKGGRNAGQENSKIPVYGPDGQSFEQSIGNGSLVEVSFNIFEVANFKKAGTHLKPAILSVKVLDHIPYTNPERIEEKVHTVGTPGKHRKMGDPEDWSGDVV